MPRTLELCSDLPDEAKVGPRIDKDIDPPELLLDTCRPQGEEEKRARSIKGRLWHRLDDRYALPKSSLTLLFRNASVQYVNNGNDSDHTGQQQHHWHYDEATAI